MATYYISNSGNNGNNGTSSGTAWQTIAHLNSQTLLPNDIVLFERGGLWNETLVVPANTITYSAYGTGAKPVISGSMTIPSWVNEGGNVYSRTDANFPAYIELLTINGVTRHKGRFPKTTWLTANSVSGNTSVTSSSLSGTPNYDGGEIVINKISWIIDKGTITNHSGGTLTYTGTSSYNGNAGWGFFIQNHPNCLTEFGDWRYDAAAKKIFMHFGAETPSNHTIIVSSSQYVVNCNGRSGVIFQDLEFRYANDSLVNLQNSPNADFVNCSFKYAGFYGIFHNESGGFSDGTEIDDCLFEDIYDSSVLSYQTVQIKIRNSIFRRNYIYAGTGKNGDNNHNTICLGIFNSRAALATDAGFLVEDCLIEDSGYCGINFSGTNSTVRRNIIDRFCITKEDGAAIYLFGPGALGTYFTNRLVHRNLVRNGVTNGNPNGYGIIEVYGIYTDAGTRNLTISENVVEDGYCGYFINASRNLTITNNISAKNTYCEFYFANRSGGGDNEMQGLNITGNVLYAISGSDCVRINNSIDSIALYGTINNNFYIKPSGGRIIIKLTNWGNQQNYTTVAAWFSAHGYDQNTLMTPTSSSIVRVYTNETSTTANIPVGSNRIDKNGNTVSSLVSLASYESILVMEGTDPEPSEPSVEIFMRLRAALV